MTKCSTKSEIKYSGRRKVTDCFFSIKQYENEHNPIPIPDPIEAIKIKMLERGLKNKNLVGKIGSKGYISWLLKKRKPLTIDLAKLFQSELGTAPDILLS